MYGTIVSHNYALVKRMVLMIVIYFFDGDNIENDRLQKRKQSEICTNIELIFGTAAWAAFGNKDPKCENLRREMY